LVQEGFSSVEEIAYVPSAELLAVEGFDEDIVEELRARARDALLTEALAVEEGLEEHQPSEELLALEGMDEATAYALAARVLFMEKLEVDEEIANILVQEGFSSVEEIAYVPSAELLAVEGFDEDIVEELRARARDALLTEALAAEEGIEEHQPSEELLALDGMDEATAYALAAREISTVDDLADLAVDDLIDIEGIDEERAAALIMAARAPMIERLEKGG
ncbi:MAG: hypothetical protein KGL16_00960, partial [Acidobacteriota bacterium]|nr:hypothetical protein [Acidobacteriota bacterium]